MSAPGSCATALWFGLGCGLAACAPDQGEGAPPPPPFRKLSIDDEPGEPIGLALLPDGRLLHTTRDGSIWLHDPALGKSLAARLDVYTHDEEGVQGIAVAPDFEQTRWVYVYYSPRLDTPVDDAATPDVNEGDAPPFGDGASRSAFEGVMRLSRFVLEGSELALDSERVILEVPTDRGICCHVGGQIDFDGEGNLYLSTGDDTNPFDSTGYSPLDERSARHPAFDAQRSAANTNDLRGKLLRIRPRADGSYDIPEGNLFAPGTPGTRPEIYVMGLRNPFRFAVDRRAAVVYLADYAPDARARDESRGPPALGRWMRIASAANYGWPYCMGREEPYVDFDFETNTSGAAFDCERPRNTSPRNTGMAELPPVASADVSYSYGAATRFPELGSGGIGPMAGPAYAFDPARSGAGAWPEAYDGAPLFYEWVRDFIAVLHLDAAGAVARVEPLELDVRVDNPIDMEFGPDGALYVLEYGDGYFSANPEASLSRIEYVPPAGLAPMRSE